MRWIQAISVILAILAAGVSVAVGNAPAQNLLLWLPAVMAAVPLVVPTNVWACLVATVWLLVFALLGGFAVGRFYVPAALIMLVATLCAAVVAPTHRPRRTELGGAVRLSVVISFGLAVATSVVWVLYMLHTGGYRWPAYTFVLAPILAASLPLWWRKPESMGTAAELLTGIAFFPITIEVGAWYSPAVVPMVYAAIASARVESGRDGSGRIHRPGNRF